MRRTEEEEKLKSGINTTGTTKVQETTTDIYEPDDIPLQKVGVILRSQPESNFRTKIEDVNTYRNANKTVATVAPPIPVATVHITTSELSETTVESKSNSTPSTSG